MATPVNLRLLSSDNCAYVQRSAIVLEEKGVPYEMVIIDFANKPDWFLDLSPYGKVPMLQVDDTVLFESLAIVEFLDETLAPRLHDTDPLARARDRGWFAVADDVFLGLWEMMSSDDQDELTRSAAALRTTLSKLEKELEGPLWRGDRFTMMDAVAYPGLQRARWMAERHPHLDLFRDLPRVTAWEAKLASRPSVQRSLLPGGRGRFLESIALYGAAHA